MPGLIFNLGVASGAKAQNAEWFAQNIIPIIPPIDNKCSKIRLTFALTGAVVVEVTLDSGSSWYSLNEARATVASSLYSFDIPCRDGDLFNARTPTVGGTTVTICRADGAQEEG